jgi:hypothetical protein
MDEAGAVIDFDAVYEQLIVPAIVAVGLEPVRADEEMTGVVRKPVFERLILCEYAVADLTFANANVFYELGVRHAVRPYSTVLIFASGTRLPFDVALDRGLPYSLSPAGAPTDVDADCARLAERLEAAREVAAIDSPVFQLVEGFPDISRLKTDVFRDQVRYSAGWKERMARARGEGLEAVRQAERELGDLRDVEAGILIDLYLSYRAVKGYEEMISLAGRMPRPLAKTPLVREQLGLALNRLRRRTDAEHVLLGLIKEQGPSSETYGILGRVYKDEWDDAKQAGDTFLADGLLEKAIGAYLSGFETDWRDAYPGINALTLMEMRDPPDPRREQLLPGVSYAVERRLASPEADYWDHATRLELAVLAKDEAAAKRAVASALAMVRENWEPESTANNLRLIRSAREGRGDEVPWAAAIEQALLRRPGSALWLPSGFGVLSVLLIGAGSCRGRSVSSPLTFCSVDSRRGVRSRSDRFVPSALFSVVVRRGPNIQGVVHPRGSQRGSPLGPTVRFSGRTYLQLGRIARVLPAVAGCGCLPLAAVVAGTVAVGSARVIRWPAGRGRESWSLRMNGWRAVPDRGLPPLPVTCPVGPKSCAGAVRARRTAGGPSSLPGAPWRRSRLGRRSRTRTFPWSRSRHGHIAPD